MVIQENGNVGIGTTSPYSAFDLSPNGGTTTYVGRSGIRSGVDWGSEASSHTISFPDFCEGDTSSGMILIHAKANGTHSTAKAGTALVLWAKSHGDGTTVTTVSSIDQKMTTFSVSTSSNNITVSTDADCAITWQSLYAR